MDYSIRLRLEIDPKTRPLYLTHTGREWLLLQSNGGREELAKVSYEPVLFAFALDDVMQRHSADPDIVKRVLDTVREFCDGWKVNILPHKITMPKPVEAKAEDAVPLPDSIMAMIAPQGSA